MAPTTTILKFKEAISATDFQVGSSPSPPENGESPIARALEAVVKAIGEFIQTVADAIGETDVWRYIKDHAVYAYDWTKEHFDGVVYFITVSCVQNHPFWTAFGCFLIAGDVSFVALIINVLWILLQVICWIFIFQFSIILGLILLIISFASSDVRRESFAYHHQTVNYGATGTTPAQTGAPPSQTYIQHPQPSVQSPQPYIQSPQMYIHRPRPTVIYVPVPPPQRREPAIVLIIRTLFLIAGFVLLCKGFMDSA